MIISLENIIKTLSFLVASIAICSATPGWYETTRGKRYLIEPESKYNWLQSYDHCARRGLQLIHIGSRVKNTDLIALLRTSFGSSIANIDLWIGLHDEFNTAIDKTRPFYSIATGEQITFSHWDENEPNNYNGEENCAHLRGARDLHWNDGNCITWKFGYICEEIAKYCSQKTPIEQSAKMPYEIEFEVTQTAVREINVNTVILTNNALLKLQNSSDGMFMELKTSIEEVLEQKHLLEKLMANLMNSLKDIIFKNATNVAMVNT